MPLVSSIIANARIINYNTRIVIYSFIVLATVIMIVNYDHTVITNVNYDRTVITIVNYNHKTYSTGHRLLSRSGRAGLLRCQTG